MPGTRPLYPSTAPTLRQTRGEWVKLGDFIFKKGTAGSISIRSDEPGIHADGILFVKK